MLAASEGNEKEEGTAADGQALLDNSGFSSPKGEKQQQKKRCNRCSCGDGDGSRPVLVHAVIVK